MAALLGSSRHKECALCMETFTSPRLLPCFHTFCLGCLQQLVCYKQRVDSFPCPTCRTTANIPPGGVEKFQVNFYIEPDVESSSNVVRTCDICCKVPATHKCCDCDQFACNTCTTIHATFSATKSHTVLNLTQTAGNKAAVLAKKERYCSRHKEEKIRFFCTQCSTVICRDCKLTSHEGHASTDLSEKSSEAKQLVLQVTRRSRDNLAPKLRQALQEVQVQKKKVQASKKTILGTLEQRAADLKQEIDKSLAEAKGKLNQETDDVDKIASRCIDNMTQELTCFLSLVDKAQRVAESGCDADILEMPTQMMQFFGVADDSAPVADDSAPVADDSAPVADDSAPVADDSAPVADDSAPVAEQRHQYGGYCGFDNGVKPLHSMPAFGLGQIPVSTFSLGASNLLGAAFQIPALVQQTQYLSVNQPTSVPDCQLKSFTSEEWKVDVHLTEKNTLKTGPNSYSSKSESSEDVLATIQKAIPQYIGHVTRSRQSQADACDEFEDDLYEDVYKDEDNCGDSSGEEYDDFLRSFRGRSPPPPAPRLQPLVSVGASRPRSSANSTTSQIATEINAIRSILSGWQTLATEKKTKTNVW